MTAINISKQTQRRFVLGKQGLWPGRRWKGLNGTAQAISSCEAVQLDPLNVAARSQDIVSARGCAMKLFDFDYKWEVYVPAEKRRWGYYVLPILYGDDLVARLDPKLDRTTMTLEIKGFWHEDDAPVKDLDFANALAKGLIRFAKFVGARKVNVSSIRPINLRRHVQKMINESLG